MRVGIYSPYLDSLGGGERYILTIAEILSKEHQVDLLIDQHHVSLGPEKLKTELSQRLNLDLSNVKLVEAPLGAGSSSTSRLFFLRGYDLLFYLTDGSLFYATAKKNIIHFQVPFKNTINNNLWGKIKLSSWDLAICNSKFTQSVIEKEWPLKCRVVYPPVAVEEIKPSGKKKQILSVGRFASFSRSKKHEEMIKAFKGLYEKGKVDGWSLHLAGSVEGDKEYIEELKKLAEGLPVFFYPNCPFKDLTVLYGESSIYWHAAGFGEEDPAKMEHFGITTVEAMAGGCVPIVINKGGQTEIVEDGQSGFLWNNIEELKDLTVKVIGNESLMMEVSKKAILRSKIFSKNKFAEKIQEVINV